MSTFNQQLEGIRDIHCPGKAEAEDLLRRLITRRLDRLDTGQYSTKPGGCPPQTLSNLVEETPDAQLKCETGHAVTRCMRCSQVSKELQDQWVATVGNVGAIIGNQIYEVAFLSRCW